MNVSILCVDIGGIVVRVSTIDDALATMLGERYRGFLKDDCKADWEFKIETISPQSVTSPQEMSVVRRQDEWVLERGDFRATWVPSLRQGWIRQTTNPYSTDSVLRIVHSLVLAEEGGFLLHASSVVRNGKAMLFCGISGAGKTTISRLAPADAVLLTDEISYVRRNGNTYRAYGTPFAGEMEKSGENVSAPIAAAFLLAKGPRNEILDVKKADAMRKLMRNILFFADDATLVRPLFETSMDFVCRVPVKQLTFIPKPEVWELIA